MPPEDTDAKITTANPSYAGFQLARALSASESHADADVRGRAGEKAKKWVSVLEGMLSGRLTIGSREPIPAAPVWATPEVVTGGFVTGQLLANGPLLGHERELAARIKPDDANAGRRYINCYYLTDDGLAELTARLHSGRWNVQVPEEGALLVAAWLLSHGHADEAGELLATIAPHFPALRFYPVPSERAVSAGARIFLETVGRVLERLRAVKPNLCVLAAQETVTVWIPLYDRMTALFLETVSGDAPAIQPDAEGRWVSPDSGRFYVAGGWPCNHYPADWRGRAAQLATEIISACAINRLSKKKC